MVVVVVIRSCRQTDAEVTAWKVTSSACPAAVEVASLGKLTSSTGTVCWVAAKELISNYHKGDI